MNIYDAITNPSDKFDCRRSKNMDEKFVQQKTVGVIIYTIYIYIKFKPHCISLDLY